MRARRWAANIPAMEAAPPPPIEPRPLGRLLPESWDLFRQALPEVAAVLVWGALPAAVITVAASAITGIEGRETLKAAVEAEEYARVGAATSLGLASRFLAMMAGLAVYPVLAGRLSGTALGPQEAYARAFERLVPLVLTFLRQLLYIVLGTLCLVIPGVVLAFRYALSQPAVMLEGLSGPEALARSKQFMTGHPGKVVGNMVVAWVLCIVGVVAAVFGLGLVLLAFELVTPSALHPLLSAVHAVAGAYADALGGAWLTTFLVLLYGDLTVRHPLGEKTV